MCSPMHHNLSTHNKPQTVAAIPWFGHTNIMHALAGMSNGALAKSTIAFAQVWQTWTSCKGGLFYCLFSGPTKSRGYCTGASANPLCVFVCFFEDKKKTQKTNTNTDMHTHAHTYARVHTHTHAHTPTHSGYTLGILIRQELVSAFPPGCL